LSSNILTYKGEWRDTYTFEDGSSYTTEWRPNQAQNSSATLSAILFGSVVQSSSSAYGGIQYLALGGGDSNWDLSPPTQNDKPYSATTLVNEIDRIQVANGTNVAYLDPVTEAVSVTPTRVLQVNILIPFDRGIGDLREFALFGGDATSTQDSGYMINWVTHSVISKDSRVQILRQLKLKWLTLEEVTI